MNPSLLALTVTALGCLCGLAQQAPPTPASPTPPDPVADAIDKFFATRASDQPANEITVDLPPPAAAPAPAPKDPAGPAADQAEDTPTPAPTPPAAADTSASAKPAPEPSLTVQVEKLQTGSGAVDPKTVKLLAPFPAKPLTSIPSGWRLDSSTSAPPFIRKVDIAPGASITLTIRPHLLIPDAAAFAVAEPGFDPSLGYRQAHTISSILANSIQQLDDDAKHLGNAIDQLQQLVSSLPRSAPKP